MSKSAERDLEFMGKQLLKQPRLAALRKQMEEFIDEHGETGGLKSRRRDLATGMDLSKIVDEGRDKRL
jgi:hypothetical protein